MKSPFAIALEKYLESEDGLEAQNIRTLDENCDPKNAEYLRNRLRMAFNAGWNACSDRMEHNKEVLIQAMVESFNIGRKSK